MFALRPFYSCAYRSNLFRHPFLQGSIPVTPELQPRRALRGGVAGDRLPAANGQLSGRAPPPPPPPRNPARSFALARQAPTASVSVSPAAATAYAAHYQGAASRRVELPTAS